MCGRGSLTGRPGVGNHYLPEGWCSFQYSSRCLRRDVTRSEIPKTRAIAAIPRKIQLQSSDPRKIAFAHVAIRPITIKRSAARVSLLFIPESNHDDDAVSRSQGAPAKGRIGPVPKADGLPPTSSLATQGANRPNEEINRTCFQQRVRYRSIRSAFISNIYRPEHQPQNDPNTRINGRDSGCFHSPHVMPLDAGPPIIAQSLTLRAKTPGHGAYANLKPATATFVGR